MKKALIFLQEVGNVPLPDGLTGTFREMVNNGISSFTENINDILINVQSMNKYTEVALLTDRNCTRDNLLDKLIYFSTEKYVVDLVIWGHGSANVLKLHGTEKLTPSNIKTLQSDAKEKGCNELNLRMVYMCNCYGSTLNDDWLALGAKVSIGSKKNDYMPTPMTPFFIYNWINGQTAEDSARNAYEATIPFFTPLYPPLIEARFQYTRVPYPCPTWSEPLKICYQQIQTPDVPRLITNKKITDSRLIVGGNRDMKF